MDKHFRVSVVVATYNGAKYIREQLESIVSQLRVGDEVIITDDGSCDATLDIARAVQVDGVEIKIIIGPKRGVIMNFENGIRYASNEIIFLADQDDVWCNKKVSTIVNLFERDPELSCILHDVAIVDHDLNLINKSFFQFRCSRPGIVRNYIRNSFMGSAMAFRTEMTEYFLPIPSDIAMHDQWIGLICSIFGKTLFLSDQLGFYRRHENNVSSLDHGSIRQMVSKRFVLLVRLLNRCINCLKHN